MRLYGGILVFVVIIFCGLLFMGYLLNVTIHKYLTFQELAREGEIYSISNIINVVERSLGYALFFSYRQAMKELGYKNFSEIQDLQSFTSNVSRIFNEYRKKLEEVSGIKVPNGDIKISSQDNITIEITFTSPQLITYSYKGSTYSFTIFGNPNTSISFVEENGKYTMLKSVVEEINKVLTKLVS